jgi:hypothetical protein
MTGDGLRDIREITQPGGPLDLVGQAGQPRAGTPWPWPASGAPLPDPVVDGLRELTYSAHALPFLS